MRRQPPLPGNTRRHSASVRSNAARFFFQDAARILELKQQIKALEDEMARIAKNSGIARQLLSMPGYGQICSAELAGETVERFRNDGPLSRHGHPGSQFR